MNEITKNLIIKFLTKEANLDELQQLELWIGNPENEKLFFEYIKTNTFVNMTMSNYNYKSARKNIARRIRQEKRPFNVLAKYAAAAAVVLIIGSGYIFRDIIFNNPVKNIPIIANTKIEPGTDKATLTLEDGSHIALEKGKSFQTGNAKSNGKEIVYDTQKQKTTEVMYNYLTIPRGGQYYVRLSDGTEVWLNSESQLKYPVSFRENETRQVELVYGEAYFDVSPSTEHNGSKFKVFNQYQEVEVIGTEFNIKAYKDEVNVYTTLIEGLIDVSIENRKQSLIPNQQLNLNLNTNVAIVKNVEIYNEVSWKEGVFSFDGKSIQEIMKVLSRWYDINIIFKNKIGEDLEFVGVLRKNKSIEEILSNIKNSGIIMDYEIKGKEVILK